MEKTIKFNRTVQFLGRNGGFKCTGVSVLRCGNETIMIEPITSRGEIGRCFIEIPIEDVIALCNLLQEISASSKKFKSK